MCTMVLNEKLNGVELHFEGKPEKEVINSMKSVGFRWGGSKLGYWYCKQSEKALNVAKMLSGGEVKEAVKEVVTAKKVNVIDLWSLCQFEAVAVEKNYNTKEIAKEIRSILKNRFKFVKFSVTCPRGERISIEIKSAPFEVDSIYLKAIQDYVEKLVENYNFCTCYDPYGDYGSSYNFYFFGCKVYDYQQTEVTEEIKEAVKNFDIKVIEAEEQKRIEEERQYQEYLKQREIDRIEAEERQKKEAEEKEYINNNVEIVEVEEEKQYFVINADFANLNKNNTLAEYQEEVEKGDSYKDTLKVTRELHFKDIQALKYFENMLLHDFDFIDGTGGSYTEDLRINSMTDYNNMDEEERNTVQWLLSGIAVYYNNELMFVIDAQGYCYARYVGLVGADTKVTKKIEYKQVVTLEEVEELKVEAEEITNVYNSIVEKNTLEYADRKAVSQAIKENCLLSFDKSIIQQITDEITKINLYRVLKENDTIQDQFKDNTFTVGDKLTVVKTSMIGGAGINHIIIDSVEEIENSIKLIFKVKGKSGLYTMTMKDNKEELLYRNWIDIPTNVLYEDTSNQYFKGSATRFGSYDTKALDAIIEYLQEKNILPVVNTYKPVF